MKWYGFIFIGIALIFSSNMLYQIYKMTELDATSRGLKHPKFWGLFTVGGNNSSGLFLYLIGRQKYPSSMGEIEREQMEIYISKIGIDLIFFVGAAIGLAVCIFLTK